MFFSKKIVNNTKVISNDLTLLDLCDRFYDGTSIEYTNDYNGLMVYRFPTSDIPIMESIYIEGYYGKIYCISYGINNELCSKKVDIESNGGTIYLESFLEDYEIKALYLSYILKRMNHSSDFVFCLGLKGTRQETVKTTLNFGVKTGRIAIPYLEMEVRLDPNMISYKRNMVNVNQIKKIIDKYTKEYLSDEDYVKIISSI